MKGILIELWSKRLTPVKFYLRDLQGLRTHYWLYPKRARELRYVNHLGEQFSCKFLYKWDGNTLTLTPLRRSYPKPLNRNRRTPMTWMCIKGNATKNVFLGLIYKQTGFTVDFYKTL